MFQSQVKRATLLSLITTTALAVTCNYPQSVTADFNQRDQLFDTPVSTWYNSWGPKAQPYPAPQIPSECDPITWQRQRIIEVAKKYIGLPYRHHHVPNYSDNDGPGLDCSNFSAWVYNYGLGIKLSSQITRQAQTAGRELDPTEPFQPGDLLFLHRAHSDQIVHVVIYLDPQHIIDEHGSGVKIREFKGWYKNNFAYARRVIE